LLAAGVAAVEGVVGAEGAAAGGALPQALAVSISRLAAARRKQRGRVAIVII
jgi:hypothetical protein